MPVSYLLNGLGGDQSPRSATTTLQTYVLQLRNSLVEGLNHQEYRRGTQSFTDEWVTAVHFYYNLAFVVKE